MTTLFSICLRLAAILCGGGLIWSQILVNTEEKGLAAASSGLGLAAIVLPFAMGVAAAVIGDALRGKHYGRAAVALVFAGCSITHTGIAALERNVAAREMRAAGMSVPNTRIDLTKKALDNANARVKELETATARPCRTVGRTGQPSKECVAARAELQEARTEASRKQAERVQAGAAVDTNGMEKRYGAFANVIDNWHPLLLPVSLELGAMVLIAFGFSQSREAKPLLEQRPLSKHDAAVAAIRDMAAENGNIPTHKEVVVNLGLPKATASRARADFLKQVG